MPIGHHANDSHDVEVAEANVLRLVVLLAVSVLVGVFFVVAGVFILDWQ